MKPLERLKKLNTKENLWIYILSLLSLKERYGYEIPNLIQEKFKFKPGKITPYRVLYRLEKENLVQSTFKERKRIYKITKEGKKLLKQAKEFYENLLKYVFN